MATKKIEFKTPKGIAKYPHITERDTGHQYSSGKFDTKIILTKEDAAPLVTQLEALAKAEKIKDPKMPYKADDDGNFVFSAKSEYPPTVLDARGTELKPLPKSLRIRGGSVIRIAGAVNVYEKGVSLWLNLVQIIELAQTASPFEADESGSFSANDFADETSDTVFDDAPAL
jgi:hypothetical protein